MVFKVCVIGAGVIGTSTAVNILEQIPNVEVTILADRFSPATTSDGVAGLILPYLAGKTPQESLYKWCKSTFDHLVQILGTPEAEEVGVHLKSGYELFDEYQEDPFWKDIVLDFKRYTQTELNSLFPIPGIKDGWHFTTLFCQPVLYIPLLMKRFQARGGKTMKQSLSSLSEISDLYDVIVVCTGIGSRQLLGDEEVYPIKGQLVKMTNPGLSKCYTCILGSSDTCIFPFTDYLYCGGTTEVNNWNADPDPEICQDIIERCTKFVPSLKRAKVMGRWAGLRPARFSMRLEREDLQIGANKKKIVYNYGHGGSGVTVHWGCAMDATELVRKCLAELHQSKL